MKYLPSRFTPLWIELNQDDPLLVTPPKLRYSLPLGTTCKRGPHDDSFGHSIVHHKLPFQDFRWGTHLSEPLLARAGAAMINAWIRAASGVPHS